MSQQQQQVVTPEMEIEAKRHQELQNEIQDLTNSRQKQLSQLNENTMVKQEMELISGDAVVYKKIGPTLVKQDLSAAKDLISKRMEFVERSIKSLDKNVEKKQEEMSKIENRVQELQNAAMQKQQGEQKRSGGN
jgi:prefoldin beta subunit